MVIQSIHSNIVACLGDAILNNKSRAARNPSLRGAKSTLIEKRTRQSAQSSKVATALKRRRISPKLPNRGKVDILSVERAIDVDRSFVELDVKEVYKSIRKRTGALGGNGSGGAIYGEITITSFQRIVDYMKEHCDFSEASLFLDVGSGLGKPSFHVSVDPGVEVSFGVELEEIRWHLSLHNLKSILQDIKKFQHRKIMFSLGDITQAGTLDPFSHIYSFDVGFPPNVMSEYAGIFNRSAALYIASFHGPRKIIQEYKFDVELLGQVVTSMSGSSEIHTCYFYRRQNHSESTVDPPLQLEAASVEVKVHSTAQPLVSEGILKVDPMFQSGFEVICRGAEGVLQWVIDFFERQTCCGRTRRQKAVSARLILDQKLEQRQLQSYYRVVAKQKPSSMGCKTEKSIPKDQSK